MGRTLKRVPLDFAWPIDKLWEGYLNPFGGQCPEENKTCFGGYTAAGKWLESVCRLISLIAEDGAEPRRRGTWPHPYLEEFSQAPRFDVPRDVHARIREIDDTTERMGELSAWLRRNPRELLPPTKEFTTFAEGLNEGLRIDAMCGSMVSWRIQKSLLKAAGVDSEKWGICPICEGNADDPAKRAEYEAWKPTEPPKGDGYQLWNTTTEGHPMSPVFASMDELCAWCADNATTFASFKASAEEWRQMLDADFVHHVEGSAIFL